MNTTPSHMTCLGLLAGVLFLFQAQSSLAASNDAGKNKEGVSYTFFADAEDERERNQDAKFDSLKSILSKELKGDDEFSRNEYKPIAEKRYNELLSRKFLWVGTFDLPEYDFSASTFRLIAPNRSGDAISNLYGCKLTRRIAPVDFKIDAKKAKALKKSLNGRYQVKIVFAFVGMESKQDVISRINSNPAEKFLSGWDPQTHCAPVEGRILIGGETVALNLSR